MAVVSPWCIAVQLSEHGQLPSIKFSFRLYNLFLKVFKKSGTTSSPHGPYEMGNACVTVKDYKFCGLFIGV
jgi:hypothetical protein